MAGSWSKHIDGMWELGEGIIAEVHKRLTEKGYRLDDVTPYQIYYINGIEFDLRITKFTDNVDTKLVIRCRNQDGRISRYDVVEDFDIDAFMKEVITTLHHIEEEAHKEILAKDFFLSVCSTMDGDIDKIGKYYRFDGLSISKHTEDTVMVVLDATNEELEGILKMRQNRSNTSQTKVHIYEASGHYQESLQGPQMDFKSFVHATSEYKAKGRARASLLAAGKIKVKVEDCVKSGSKK
jgi:hypothetical protein